MAHAEAFNSVHTGGASSPSIEHFKESVSALRFVRDIIVHHDAYLAGTGNLQKSGNVPEPPSSRFGFPRFEMFGPGDDDGPSVKTIVVEHIESEVPLADEAVGIFGDLLDTRDEV